MRVTTFQYKISAKITFAQSKHFPPEHNLPVREKKNHWNKQHFGTSKSRVLPPLSSSPSETAVKGFLLLTINIPRSLPMTRAMTAQRVKEFHWMRLIDLEGDTNFTLQNQSAVKGQKLGLCL